MKFLSSRGSPRKYTFQEAAIHDENSTENQALRDVLPSLVRRSFTTFRSPEAVKIRQLVPTTSKHINGRKNEENHGKEAEHRYQAEMLTTTDTARPRLTKADIPKEQAYYAAKWKDEQQPARASEEEAAEWKEEQQPGRASEEERPEAEGLAQGIIGPRCNQRDKIFLLELFHGPTFAFKDIALQFLGELLSYLQQKEKKTYVVLGATSGDTGSAAIAALKNRSPGLHTVILFPKDRVSPIQKLQMVTANDSRVHCLQVDGTFDDCQEMLKDVLNEYQSQTRLRSLEKEVDTTRDTTSYKAGPAGRLCVVNSINCTRILVQTAYWWYAALQLEKLLQERSEKSVSCSPSYPTFIVPTGNFGNIFSCLFAKLMGAPIGKLLMATNSNDVLVQAYNHGFYQKRGSVNQTCSPSMDIAAASNFERLLLLEKLLHAQHPQEHCYTEEAVQQYMLQSCFGQEKQRTESNAKDWLGPVSLSEKAAPAAVPPATAVIQKCVSKIQKANLGAGTTKQADGQASSKRTDEQDNENVPMTPQRCATSENVVRSSGGVTTPSTTGAPKKLPEKTSSTRQGPETTSAVAEERSRGSISVQTDTGQLSTNALKFFRKYFLAVSVDDEETKAAIRNMFMTYNEIIDPHTAVGYAAYLKKNICSLRTPISTPGATKALANADLCTGLDAGTEEIKGERFSDSVRSDSLSSVQPLAETQSLPHQLKQKDTDTTGRDFQGRPECSLLSPCSTYLLACTAHFGKFPETVLPQIGWAQEKCIPQELRNLHLLQQRFQNIPPRAELLSDMVKKIFTVAAEDCCAKEK